MTTNFKIFAAILLSLGLMSACSTSKPKTESPFNTAENTMSVPGGDKTEQISTSYSSANLGTASSGMGR